MEAIDWQEYHEKYDYICELLNGCRCIGGNSKARNLHMQTMLRLVGFGDNAGSGFQTILDVWKSEGWVEHQLIKDTNFNHIWAKE